MEFKITVSGVKYELRCYNQMRNEWDLYVNDSMVMDSKPESSCMSKFLELLQKNSDEDAEELTDNFTDIHSVNERFFKHYGALYPVENKFYMDAYGAGHPNAYIKQVGNCCLCGVNSGAPVRVFTLSRTPNRLVSCCEPCYNGFNKEIFN